ncbi:transcriptional regulator, TetR family [Streptomyces sp. 2112.3]|uniref:TetR/AcrR family transcriptional regulator n=1 Tax=Streptomyces sp. 2112.3 TaxID=1881023 RepID=UPI000895C4DF|nr:TetR/AcrR family transcriptional regulator [Streptomyces sp. 2112.3]SEE80932.1 transcriptional regulator, TetR family [Streptomyces sp. 2112.3]
MHIQGSHWQTNVAVAHAADDAGSMKEDHNGTNGAHGVGSGSGNGTGVRNGARTGTNGARTGTGAGGRSTPLRVDAQRNLEHVLRAAREVFGELGYGAPMEDVARRARVGVGTVYRRFPSKDVLVRRIAEEETARLTDQARTALGQEDDAWSALSRFLRTSVASGAGRLLPPGILRVSADADRPTEPAADGTDGPRVPDGLSEARIPDGLSDARVPQQRMAPGTDGVPADLRLVAARDTSEGEPGPADGAAPATAGDVDGADAGAGAGAEEMAGADALLEVVGRLVERARTAGELRADVTVADILLVIATGAPTLPEPSHQQAASTRLLEILLEGLRSRPAE